MDQLITILIAVLGVLGFGAWFRHKKNLTTNRDADTVLIDDKIKKLKKQQKEVNKLTKKSGKEFEDAYLEYCRKYGLKPVLNDRARSAGSTDTSDE